MRLRQYLNEEVSLEELASILKRDCSKFLKEASKPDALYRGIKKSIPYYIKKKSRLENRSPRNTNPKLHKALNGEFTKKFGWPVRNGIFVTSSTYNARYYNSETNEAYMFFPIGDYKYCWSPDYADLVGKVDSYVVEWFADTDNVLKSEWIMKYNKKMEYEDFVREMYPKISNLITEEIKNIVNRYVTHNLPKAINTGNEVSFNCKGYYLVNRNWAEYYLEDNL